MQKSMKIYKASGFWNGNSQNWKEDCVGENKSAVSCFIGRAAWHGLV